jgi:hypothetical protein
MAWWVRRDQWPHVELGPFNIKAEADELAAQFAQLPPDHYPTGEWTWTVLPGDFTGTHR